MNIRNYLSKLFPRAFQCGDTVEVIGNSNGHGYEIGTVLKLGRQITPGLHHVWYGPKSRYIIRTADIKLLEKVVRKNKKR